MMTENPRLRYGIKNGVAMTIGVAAVAALVFTRGCGDKGGQDRLPPPVPVEKKCPAPVPDKCNLELGEHDPFSPNWAPAKCGFCGDGIIQPWETQEKCPVDFHCGNGEVDRNAVFGAVIEPKEAGGVYKIDYVTITESCKPADTAYCEADCPTKAGPAGSARKPRTPREPSGAAPVETAPAASGGQCKPEISGKFFGRARSNLNNQIEAVRTQAGSTGQSVLAHVAISVSSGVPAVKGIRLECSGCKGGTINPTTVNLSGLAVGSEVSCSTTLDIPLSRE
jgi:hypothetical protein